MQSYLEHHGDKLGRRFDPNSYLVLTEAMNSHDIGRGRGGVDAALQRISAELTVAVVDSDRLFLPAQGELIATAPTARPLITMHSDYGHDGFLIEAERHRRGRAGCVGGLSFQASGGRRTGRSVCAKSLPMHRIGSPEILGECVGAAVTKIQRRGMTSLAEATPGVARLDRPFPG